MAINRQFIFFTIGMIASSCLSAVIPMVVTNGLSNTCTQYSRRGCVKVDKSAMKPSFFERRTNTSECELSVVLSIAHSRYQIADGLIFPKVRRFPLSIDSLPNCPYPYSINGINLTNMVARVFAFSTCPMLATNDLKVTLVSFGPFKSFITLSFVIDTPATFSPSTVIIRSPASTPIFSQGPPGMTSIIVIVSLIIENDTPTPLNDPWSSSLVACRSLAGMYVECGSSWAIISGRDFSITLSVFIGSTYLFEIRLRI